MKFINSIACTIISIILIVAGCCGVGYGIVLYMDEPEVQTPVVDDVVYSDDIVINDNGEIYVDDGSSDAWVSTNGDTVESEADDE